MKVQKKISNNWLNLRHKGDADKIAELAGVSPITVYRAYKGSASPDLIAVMNKFYEDRLNLVTQPKQNVY